jgi:hypothetical protein
MAQVTTCPYCGRTVGLMSGKSTPGSFPRTPRIALHAAEEPRPSGHGVRRKCVEGSSLEVDPDAIRDEPGPRPSHRRGRATP